jgi:ribosomal protein S18 acetylase RimI-like enzyme
MLRLSKQEILELFKLDALCFPAPLNYPLDVMRHFVRQRGAYLVRKWDGKKLIAFVLCNSESGEIITLDVHSEYRRKGLGKELLLQAIEALRQKGVRTIFSQVATTNTPSLMLHLRTGFKIRRVIPCYYPDGTSAYVLVLPATSIGRQPPSG